MNPLASLAYHAHRAHHVSDGIVVVAYLVFVAGMLVVGLAERPTGATRRRTRQRHARRQERAQRAERCVALPRAVVYRYEERATHDAS